MKSLLFISLWCRRNIIPFWISRPTSINPLGDGDKKGVDLALVKLSQPVTGLLPVPLPLKIHLLWDKRSMFQDLEIWLKAKLAILI